MRFDSAQMKSHDCFVCGGEHTEFRFQKAGYVIVRCIECGFVFVNPRYTEAEVARVYDEGNWFELLGADNGKKNYADTVVSDVTRFEKDMQSIEKFKQPGLLLDVGCGLGYVLDAGTRRGWKTFGVDVSNHATAVCRAKGHHNVKSGVLKASDWDRKQFDCVTAFDVLSMYVIRALS